jgi:Protein of unknown function (DUF1579)
VPAQKHNCRGVVEVFQPRATLRPAQQHSARGPPNSPRFGYTSPAIFPSMELQSASPRPAKNPLARAKEMLMNRTHARRWIPGAVALACAVAGAALAQPQSAGKPEPSGHPPEATPRAKNGETPHQFLAKRAGEWTRTVRFVGQPGGAGEPFTGTATISAIDSGRFLLEEYHDVVFGRPITGTRLFGYNTITGQYEAAFTGTTSPAILMLKGMSSDGGKVVDYSGESESARGEKFTLNVRVRQVDDDHIVMSFSMTGPDGKPSTFQETTYTRKK